MLTIILLILGLSVICLLLLIFHNCIVFSDLIKISDKITKGNNKIEVSFKKIKNIIIDINGNISKIYNGNILFVDAINQITYAQKNEIDNMSKFIKSINNIYDNKPDITDINKISLIGNSLEKFLLDFNKVKSLLRERDKLVSKKFYHFFDYSVIQKIYNSEFKIILLSRIK